jgi:hypothetical protein
MMATALSVMARICRPSTTLLATGQPNRGCAVGAGDDWGAQILRQRADSTSPNRSS